MPEVLLRQCKHLQSQGTQDKIPTEGGGLTQTHIASAPILKISATFSNCIMNIKSK